MAREISSSVVAYPVVRRRLPSDSSMLSPIASSTCDGSSEPDAHAEPLDAATPARSRASNTSSPLRPANVQLAKFGNRGSPPVSVPPSSSSALRSACAWPSATRARDSRPADAAASATATAVADVASSWPARRPHSCGPPKKSGSIRTPSRTRSNPPRPAPSLWPLNDTRSAPAGAAIHRWPAHASTWTNAPTSCARAITSATGWMVPTSLLASPTETRPVPGVMAPTSTVAAPSTPATTTSRPNACSLRIAASTDWCSADQVTIRAPFGRRAAAPNSARLVASVPEETKVTSVRPAPSASAATSRARSRAARAARPSACGLEGLPACTSRIAASTSDRTGADPASSR